MGKVYFGISQKEVLITGSNLRGDKMTVNEVKELQESLIPCYNISPSQQAIVNAIAWRFGVKVPTTDAPKKVTFEEPGDCIIVATIDGLPNLGDRDNYTKEEIVAANFRFLRYTYLG